MFYCTDMNLFEIQLSHKREQPYSVFSETAPVGTPPSSPLSHLGQGQGSSW